MGRGATSQASQHCLSLSVSELGNSLFPWELDLRCLLLEPHLAGILPLGERKSLLWGDASCGNAFGGSLLFPSQPVTCFSGNSILFFLPLALTCLPSILYHMRSEEWWITGWVRKTMLPVLIPGASTLSVITLDKLLESVYGLVSSSAKWVQD